MKKLSPTARIILLLAVATILPAINGPYIHAGASYGRMHRLDGLAKELVRGHTSNIQQDRKGFMWFATWNGIIRYDGYTTHTFKPILNSDGTIDSNRIYNIKVSSDDRLWCVSSDSRLFLFDPATSTFTNLSASVADISGRKVKSLTPLRNGATWATFHDGSCIRLNDTTPLEGYEFHRSAGDFVKGATRISGISLAENGDEWVLTDKGARNLSGKDLIEGKYLYVESIYRKTYLIAEDGSILQPQERRLITTAATDGRRVRYVRTDGHLILMGTDMGILSVDTRDGRVTSYSALPATYLFKDSRRRLWGFGPGYAAVLIPDLGRPASTTLTSTPSSHSDTLKNPQLIIETADTDNDSHGEIIIRPNGGVLCRYDESEGRLLPVSMNGTFQATYDPTGIKKFTVDLNGSLWVLHDDGVDCMSFHSETFVHTPNSSGCETRALAADSHGHLWKSDRSGTVTCGDFTIRLAKPAYVIRESPTGEIWIGTKGDGVHILSPRGDGNTYSHRHLTRHPSPGGTAIHSDTIYDIAFDRNGHAWLGSYGNGLAKCIHTPEGLECKRVRNQPRDMKIRSILPTADGTLLLGTADGLVTTDAGRSDSPVFHTNKFRPEPWGLKGNDVMCVTVCRGRYYACVFGSGISRIDSDSLLSSSLRFTTYSLPPSADAEQICGAVTDGDCIWIVSGGLLTRFSTVSGNMTPFRADSFTGNVAFSEATPVNSEGLITLGTSTGTMSFNPAALTATAATPAVRVTGILYQDDMTVNPLNNPGEITLPPDRRSFSLLFSTLVYDMDAPRMRYRLEGLDDGWNYTGGSRPAATYSNLTPGDYRLAIETLSPDGEWHATGDMTDIHVTPRFTETFLFRMTVVLVIICIIIGLVIATVHYKRMRNAVQRKYSLLMTVDRISGQVDPTRQSTPDTEGEADKADKERFLEASIRFLTNNIDNPDLMVEDFARHMGMSRTAYYNRMKETAGVPPIDFIRQMRIKRALKLLETGKYTISEVAYMSGFADPKYFSRCFKAEMSMTPSQYAEKSKGK